MIPKVDRYNQINKINEWLKSDIKKIAFSGITDSFAALLLSDCGNRQILVITESEAQAKRMAKDIETFTEKPVFFLPGREINFYDAYAHSRETESERAMVLGHVLNGKPIIVTTAVDNMLIPFRKPDDYRDCIVTVKWEKDTL